MSATTWARSSYGSSVILGPAQRDVLRVALRLTAHGRRPELTLGRLSELSGRPVSSVADALGRLRALGLLGVASRMGRHGGMRLWRPTIRPLELDAAKHRRAVARILGRFRLATTQARDDRPVERREPTEGSGGAPDRLRDDRALDPSVIPPAPDPFGVTPSDWRPAEAGATFRDRLRYHAERRGLSTLLELLDDWEKDR